MSDIEQQFARIMFDPLSYMHSHRMSLPELFTTPRQQSIINDMLLKGLDLSVIQELPTSRGEQQLLMSWERLPYICTLLGAYLLKSEPVCQSKLLKLSRRVRSFARMPMPGDTPAIVSVNRWFMSARIPGIQAFGLHYMLSWQKDLPASLCRRMQLLFDPVLDGLFEERKEQKTNPHLISQAMMYAKNYPDNI